VNSRLNIIATCTSRKRLPIPQALHLRTVRDHDLSARARAWCELLERDPSPIRPAAELYAGDLWRVVQSLPVAAQAAGYETELWILSAGYGLVSATAPLHAYSATFARGHQDSTPDSAHVETGNQAWWASLTEWGGPVPGAVRSLEGLARRDPGAAMLVLGSPDYIRAVEKDLLGAADSFRKPERLVVVTSRGMKGGRLDPHLIVSDVALQCRLGGARTSIHARVARLLLQSARNGEWTVRRLRSQYRAAQAEAPRVAIARRPRLSDQEICRFIIGKLSEDSSVSATGLLRRLRQAGWSCEQSRFKELVAGVRRGQHEA
jgi:hypothetical protein